jgi:hypothetical protein
MGMACFTVARLIAEAYDAEALENNATCGATLF